MQKKARKVSWKPPAFEMAVNALAEDHGQSPARRQGVDRKPRSRAPWWDPSSAPRLSSATSPIGDVHRSSILPQQTWVSQLEPRGPPA
jgi:hypothetical protein